MIKILHVINGADVGGISSFLLNYYSKIDRNKFLFDFATADPKLGPNGEKLKELGAQFYYLPQKNRGIFNHIRVLKNILKNGYDVIHVHSACTSYVDLLIAKSCKIKIRIAHGHNAIKSKQSIYMTISKFVGNFLNKLFATKCLACSKDAAIFTFGSNSLKNKKVEIFPNSIYVDNYKYSIRIKKEVKEELLRQNFDFNSDTKFIGTVGRMSEEKNQVFLIKLFSLYYKLNSNSYLILVGDGDKRNFLENEAKRLNIKERVIFTGIRTDVNRILNLFDVFVLPSIYEGFPIVGIEALSNGLPLLLSSTITSELNFVENIKYLDLNCDINIWIKYLNKFAKIGRDISQVNLVKENGYDISNSIKRLESIYEGGKKNEISR